MKVQGTDIISERNVQDTDITFERNVQGTDITCERNFQGTDSCLQHVNSIDGHYYITLTVHKNLRGAYKFSESSFIKDKVQLSKII